MEQLTQSTPERITNPNAEQAFLVDNVTELRRLQEDTFSTVNENHTIRDKKAIDLEMTHQIELYLQNKGIEETDPVYARLASELRDLSFDKIDNLTWRFGEYEGLNHPEFGFAPTLGLTGEDKLRAKQRELFGRDFVLEEFTADQSATVQVGPGVPQDPADVLPWTKLLDLPEPTGDQPAPITPNHESTREFTLEELAKAKYEAFVDKLNSPFFNRKERQAKMDAFEAAQAQYLGKLGEQQTALVEQLVQDGKSPEEINEAIRVDTEQRVNADDQAQYDLLIEKGGKRAKLLQKYANMSTKGKVATAVGGAVVLAGAGLGLGVVAGAVGAASGVVAGGIAAGRFTRGYLTRLSKLYKRNDESVTFELENTSSDPTETIQKSRDFLKNASLDQIKDAEKTRRRAVFGAMGAIAIGGLASTAYDIAKDAGVGHIAFGKIADAAEGAKDKVGAIGGGNSGGGSDSDGRPVTERPTTLPEAGNSGSDGTPDNSGGDMSGNAPEAPVNPNSWSYEALTVDPGEGWYKTFADMNIPENEWNSLLTKVGPQLHQNGWAYQMPNGTWGISRPGQLPPNMLDLIKNNR